MYINYKHSVHTNIKACCTHAGGEPGDADPEEEDPEATRRALQECREVNAALQTQVEELSVSLNKSKARVKELWSMNCAQLNEFERQMNDKDDENAMLKLKIEFVTRDSSRARRMPPLHGETGLPDSLGELPLFRRSPLYQCVAVAVR